MAGTTATTENLIVVNRFDLEVDSVTIGQVLTTSGIGDTTDVVDAPAVNGKGSRITQKAAGNTKYDDLSFTVHVTDEKFLSDWMKEVQEGKAATYRRNGSVVMFDTAGKEQLRANFVHAFPSSLSITSFSAGGNDPVTMSLTLVHEGLELVFS